MTRRNMAFIGSLLVILLSACAPATRVKLNELFTIAERETVQLEGERFTLTTELIGVEWRGDEEIPFIEATVKAAGETREITVYLYDDYEIGGYTLRITRADPFSRPPACDLIILKASRSKP